MPIQPLITFKAGECELDESSTPPKVKPKPTPGYVYLYVEDEIAHFCWRPRSASLNDLTMDLFMPPTDGTFTPYNRKPSSTSSSEPVTNGRIFVLKFASSSTRHLFWLQSKAQHPSGDPSHFSPRDLQIGEIVNQILQGEEVDVQREMANVPHDGGGGGGDDDTAMEDANAGGSDLHRAASGGAGADATGGDVREEGEESREGGADGARAATSAQSVTRAAVANFLKSLQGNQLSGGQQQAEGKVFTTLPDLLQPTTTLQILEEADESYLDSLLSHLPPTLILLASDDEEAISAEPDLETVEAVMMSLSTEQKKSIITKVLRSPQFMQSLGTLTSALRDGGLPMISEALKIKVPNGGLVQGGTVPLGGGEAVEAFLDGFKKAAGEEEQGDKMDTDQTN